MLLAPVLVFLATGAAAHTSLYSEAMFGWRPKDFTLTKSAVTPIRARDKLNIKGWFHRFLDYPPAAGKFMDIPSGGRGTYEVACGPQLTSLWEPKPKELLFRSCGHGTRKNPDGTPFYDWGAMHNANAHDAKKLDLSVIGGTAISIAYTSDFAKLKPEDMTVISVNYTSVYDRVQHYDFPANMPECPAGGCICGWHWLHGKNNKEGYGDEMYFNAYRCKVSGKTNKGNKIAKGKPAVNCEGDPKKCVVGPKQPMYLFVEEGANVAYPPRHANNPFYNQRYGWSDGAQKDAVVRR